MATVSVNKFESKSHDKPDERRSPPKTTVDVVHLQGFTLGRFTFQPGWRWSECVKPVVKTDRCENSHVGYCVEGTLTLQLHDGSKQTIGPGSSYTIPPGHDAWVEGDKPFVGIEIMSADVYAKPA
jgi:quercetin dioxygenase-like cupin family protein